MSLDPRVAIRSMEILAQQLDELEDRNRDLAGANRVLSEAIRDIEAIAQDYTDYDRDDLNRIIHICSTAGVRTAMNTE